MSYTRREFLRAGAASAAGVAGIELLALDVADARDRPVPRRVLGRTGAKVSIIGFGSAPLGQSFQSQALFDEVVGRAIDAGINYLDTAKIYDVAQERLGPIVKRNRDRLFLVTKTNGRDKAGVLKTIEESLRLLQTDRLDVVHLHNVADYDVDRIFDDDGAMQGLFEARKRGWTRFVGATAHMRVDRMAKAVATGQLDVIMTVLNFVDQHTYDFQNQVLPLARKHGTGIVAMKVLGGSPHMTYNVPTPCLMPPQHYSDAIRYALSLDGVTTAVMGFNFSWQLERALEVARAFKRLTDGEMAALNEAGRTMAARWKEHLGPAEG